MEITSRQEFLQNRKSYYERILRGETFIYPTDTIYGIGCDATNSAGVKRIRSVKCRPLTPFSVAVPSKEWIKENCILPKTAEKWLDRLPGPYTLLLKLKTRKAVAKAVNPETDVLGIRLPKNWFAKVVAELKVPVVSTSANFTGQDHMTSMDDLPSEIAEKVGFIIYDGKLGGSPSRIVKLYEGKVEILLR